MSSSIASNAPPPAAGLGVRIFQNTAVQIAGRAANLLLGFGTSVILARYLGRERMGDYGALYSYLTLFSWLATFSLEPILVREAAQRRSEATRIIHTGALLALSFASCGALLSWFLAPLFGYSGRLHPLVLIAALDLLILPSFRLPAMIFQADMKNWFPVGVSLLRQILWLLAVVLLALRSAAFYQVIVARLLCGVVEAAASLLLSYRPGALSGPRRFDRDEAMRLVRFGYPLVISAIASSIYFRIDQVMLHKMKGAAEVGAYVIATQLTEQLGLLPVALIGSLAPVLAVAAGQEEEFRRVLRIGYRILAGTAFFFCVTITPITLPAIRLLYGKQFLSTAGLINLLLWSEIPLFLGVVVTQGLIVRNLQRFLPLSTFAGAILNISLNLLLIPRWGAVGACWATITSYWFAAVLMYLLFRPTRSVAWLAVYIALPLLMITASINLFFAFWKIAAVVQFFLAGGLFIAGAWFTGAVRKSELADLREIIAGAMYAFRSESR